MNQHTNLNNDETVKLPCPACQHPLEFEPLQLISGVTCDNCHGVLGLPNGSIHQLVSTMQNLKSQKEGVARSI